jgi:hypothetical protein
MKRCFTILFCFIQCAFVAHAVDLHFTSEPSDLTVVSGATVTLSGSATASLPVSYQWIKGTSPIPGQTGSSLSFTALSGVDGGVFKLQAKTSAETITSHDATVTVVPRPGIGISQPTNNASVPNGIAFTIAATLTNGSIVTNVAFYSGATLLGNATADPFQISSTLTLGDYTLKAIASALGGPVATSAPVTIHVQNPLPEIVAQPVSLKVITNRTATFRLLAKGPSPLAYRWFHDGAPVATSSVPSLSVTATNGAAGEYKVTISNDYGSVDSQMVRFDIATPPNLLQKFWRAIPERNAEGYNSMAYGNGRLVAVGPLGTIAMSLDGIAWHDVSAPYNNTLNQVRFYNGSFWAVGESGMILNSTNATDWVYVPGGSGNLRDIAFKDGVRVLMPNAAVPSGTTITVGNGLFVAYSPVPNNAWVSANGVAWSKYSLPGSGSSPTDIQFFKNKFVLVLTPGIYTSSDGASWSNRYPTSAVTTMVASPSRLFAVGTAIIHSDDGETFVTDPGTPPSFRRAAAYNGVAYFASAVDVNTALYSSLNGLQWAPLAFPFHHDLPLVNFAKDRFFITGASKYGVYGGHADYGFDPGSWNHVDLPLPLNGVVFGNNRFYAVTPIEGGDGVYTSTNGLNFVRSGNVGLPGTARIKYEEGSYLAITSGGLYSGPNGTNWIANSIANGAYYEAAKGNGKVVAPGYNNNKVVISENNAPFEVVPIDIAGYFRSIDYGNGVFATVGLNGVAMYSGDGRHWFSATGATGSTMNRIAYGDGMFIAVGVGGQAWYSFDGVNWEVDPLHTAAQLTGIDYGNGRWLIAGADGVLLESGPRGPTDAPQLSATLSGTTLTIQITAGFGQVLRLESAASIGAPWTLLERFTSDGTAVQRTFDTAGSAEAYYRVVAE